MKKLVIASLAVVVSLCTQLHAKTPTDWAQTKQQAKGQTVYFHAWAGDTRINTYLSNISKKIQTQFGVTLKHVKISDISSTVMQLLAEKSAGKRSDGSVDLMWINGNNFKLLKEQNMLYGPLSKKIPNWKLLDKSLPITMDFAQPTEEYEAPWGVGQLVFIHDTKKLKNPPKSFAQLLSYAQQHPGRISYPQPPEFHGASFLKAALIELSNNNPALYKPVEASTYAKVSAPLWKYLDALHKVTWRQGKQFPKSKAETMQLLDDDELDLAITFNPNDAKAAISKGNLPKSAKTYAFNAGALSNLHFLAIPKNASAKQGALVVINALLSREAQIAKADPNIWGDPSVLSPTVLKGKTGKNIDQGFNRFPSISEPDPSWQDALNKSWKKRYGH